ncbi:DUF1707 domain-containing protein [Actinomadura barringtoniae]|uniref:DUF1707 domain-containing protein n=1 Tax=Actinomadura barringtoniae TaxID=1427535 RepID=A0A939PAF7_9ACTN|nr:DUF1707 domain-containing protein [Actinomadura barringtoniae]MBO2448950.1 DUF1707 domain-containing protein [Actinomadura barringtoniae]
MTTSPGSPALRASDADRDRAIELLHAAIADGRLDQAEFDERLDAALTARTLDALTPLTTDLIGTHALASGARAVIPGAHALTSFPATPPAERLTIKEKHGVVRREGRWVLPHRLAVRTAWCDVLLDLTTAIQAAPELLIDLRVGGGNVQLLLAPGMTLDANDLSTRHSRLEINRNAEDATPETLHVRLAGKMRHGKITANWQRPRR